MSLPTSFSFRESLLILRDKRFFTIFVLGFSSGFPWLLHGSILTLWMQDSGLTRSAIGYIGVVAVIYAFNWLWSPFIDQVRLPILFNKFGQRRSWILFTQMLIIVAVLLLSLCNPTENILPVALLALCIAALSATQDIVEGAYRILLFSRAEADKKIPFASAITTTGWWCGYSFIGGTLALWLGGEGIGFTWPEVYRAMAALYAGVMLLIMCSPEPVVDSEEHEKSLNDDSSVDNTRPKTNLLIWISTYITQPISEFFHRCGHKLACTILLFLFSFRLGEAMLGKMSLVFYREIGFSLEQIALYEKFFGGFAIIIFSLVGAFINSRFGIIKGMMVGGIAMAAANLLYALMAQVGPDPRLFVFTLLVDNFCQAFATVAIISFMSYFASRTYTGTQFALMTSISNFGKTTLAAGSGLLVDTLAGNWSLFFVLTTLMVIPALCLLVWLGRQLEVFETNP